jgi:hypothetical protein
VRALYSFIGKEKFQNIVQELFKTPFVSQSDEAHLREIYQRRNTTSTLKIVDEVGNLKFIENT